MEYDIKELKEIKLDAGNSNESKKIDTNRIQIFIQTILNSKKLSFNLQSG